MISKEVVWQVKKELFANLPLKSYTIISSLFDKAADSKNGNL